MAQHRNKSIDTSSSKHHAVALAIHGGASNIKLAELSEEQQQIYKQTLSTSLDSGYAILSRGGTAEEAVVASILILENSPFSTPVRDPFLQMTVLLKWMLLS